MTKYRNWIIALVVVAGAGFFGWKYWQDQKAGELPAGIASGNGRLEGHSFRWPSALAKAFGVVALVMALSVFTIGVFWQEMPAYLPEWLLPYARTLFSN